MLQQPLDQGSDTCTSSVNPDDQDRRGYIYSDEDYGDAYEEDYDEKYFDEDEDYEDDGEDDDGDQEDIYGDFSVNTKERPRVKAIPARKARSRLLSNVVPPDHQLEPSGIRPIPPEVLHVIFSYIDLPTLYHGINRVSRQFHAIARHYIELEGTWTLGTQKEEDDLLEKLRSGSVNVLKVKYPSSRTRTTGRLRPYDSWNWAWPRFVDFVTGPFLGDSLSSPNINSLGVNSLSDIAAATSLAMKDSKQPCLLNRVKKVIIDNSALPALLPFLHRVQTLELDIKTGRHDLALQPILKICSNLETLIVRGHNYSMSFIHWIKDTSTDTEEWINSHITHFSLTEASFSQDTMEAFLGSCPRLTFFKAMDVHIRSSGASSSDPPHASNVASLPLESLYRQASFLCPRLKDFALVPINPFGNYFDEQLALTAELFPRTQHLDVSLSLTEDWTADPVTINFLAQLSSIAFIGTEACNEDMNCLLKYCRMLTRLSAPDISYTRPIQKMPPSVDKGVRAALSAAEDNRQRSSTPQERKDYSRGIHVPISKVRHQKLHQRVEKRLVREEIISRRHQHLSSSWRCSRLRVLELRVGTANKDVSAEGYEEVFRFLGHACPNLEQLTLHLNTLWVGQESKVKIMRSELRTRTEHVGWPGPHTLCDTYNWYGEAKVLVWQSSVQAFQKLGRLSRLERLIVNVKNVPGVLCTSDFAFLRGAGNKNKGRGIDDVARSEFCPRLQSMRICSASRIEFGKTREELFSERQFVHALKTMRPEVTVSFG